MLLTSLGQNLYCNENSKGKGKTNNFMEQWFRLRILWNIHKIKLKEFWWRTFTNSFKKENTYIMRLVPLNMMKAWKWGLGLVPTLIIIFLLKKHFIYFWIQRCPIIQLTNDYFSELLFINDIKELCYFINIIIDGDNTSRNVNTFLIKEKSYKFIRQ